MDDGRTTRCGAELWIVISPAVLVFDPRSMTPTLVTNSWSTSRMEFPGTKRRGIVQWLLQCDPRSMTPMLLENSWSASRMELPGTKRRGYSAKTAAVFILARPAEAYRIGFDAWDFEKAINFRLCRPPHRLGPYPWTRIWSSALHWIILPLPNRPRRIWHY